LLVRARFTKFDHCVAYAAFVAGLGGILVQVAGMVAEQAATLASPHVVQWARTAPSRAEQRQVEVAAIVERQIETASLPSFVPDAPPLPLTVLAAQMDLAEGQNVKGVKRSRRARPSVASALPKGRSAAEVFGRNFGVLLVASR
jgi:hypothetical protein